MSPPDLIRCDDSLARPIRMIGPGESGGTIYEVVSAVLTDLVYADGIERVAESALAEGLDAWSGRPVVFEGPEHDATTLAADPTLQGRRQRGTVMRARYDAVAGERILTVVVHDPADCARIDAGEFPGISEAYARVGRTPTRQERAENISAVQIARRPTSVAFVRRARAGERARVRTDSVEKTMAAFSLDDLASQLDGIPDDSPQVDAICALLAAKLAKLTKAEADATAPAAPKPEEMAAIKADAEAQKLRADAAEGRLAAIAAEERKRTYEALRGRTDLRTDAATVIAAKDAPTDADIAAAKDLLLAATLRTDRADPYARPGDPPPPRIAAPKTAPHRAF